MLVSWFGNPDEDAWEELKILAKDLQIEFLEFLNSIEKNSVTTAALEKIHTVLKRDGKERR